MVTLLRQVSSKITGNICLTEFILPRNVPNLLSSIEIWNDSHNMWISHRPTLKYLVLPRFRLQTNMLCSGERGKDSCSVSNLFYSTGSVKWESWWELYFCLHLTTTLWRLPGNQCGSDKVWDCFVAMDIWRNRPIMHHYYCSPSITKTTFQIQTQRLYRCFKKYQCFYNYFYAHVKKKIFLGRM